MLNARFNKLLWTLMIFILCAQTAWAVVTNSPHDFSKLGWRGGEICISCHTPQNADTAQAGQLWNKSASVTNFSMYTSPSVDDTGTGQPGGTSRLCLSCHDGTIAVDSFDVLDSDKFFSISSVIGIGSSLNVGHPVSVPYSSKLDSLSDPKAGVTTVGSAKTKIKTGSIEKMLLTEDSIQCSSCHDVHNNYTAAEPLLKISTLGGKLCLTCHDKYHQNYRRLLNLHGKTTQSLENLLVNGQLKCSSCHNVHNTINSTRKKGNQKPSAGVQVCLNCHKKKN